MKRPVYCIHDDVSARFAPDLWIQDSEAIAIRNFDYSIAQPGIMSFSPGDFSLYHVGFYDDETGILESVSPLVMVKKGSV